LKRISREDIRAWLGQSALKIDVTDHVVIDRNNPVAMDRQFYDIYRGTHSTKGHVVLKRPRLDCRDYSPGKLEVHGDPRDERPSLPDLLS
jgi:hypothetical protein